MSIHVYEEMVEKLDIQKKIYEGIKEIHKGKVIDGQTFIKTLMEKYGK